VCSGTGVKCRPGSLSSLTNTDVSYIPRSFDCGHSCVVGRNPNMVKLDLLFGPHVSSGKGPHHGLATDLKPPLNEESTGKFCVVALVTTESFAPDPKKVLSGEIRWAPSHGHMVKIQGVGGHFPEPARHPPPDFHLTREPRAETQRLDPISCSRDQLSHIDSWRHSRQFHEKPNTETDSACSN